MNRGFVVSLPPSYEPRVITGIGLFSKVGRPDELGIGCIPLFMLANFSRTSSSEKRAPMVAKADVEMFRTGFSTCSADEYRRLCWQN